MDLAISYSARVVNAQKSGVNLKPIWDNAVYAIDSWVILAKSPHRDIGLKYINFASNAPRQVESAKLLPYAPTLLTAVKDLPDSVRVNVPAGANLNTALYGGSPEANDFWVDRLQELTERWNAWVSK